MLKRTPWMQPPPMASLRISGQNPQKQRLARTHCRRGGQRNARLYWTTVQSSRTFLFPFDFKCRTARRSRLWRVGSVVYVGSKDKSAARFHEGRKGAAPFAEKW